MSQNHMGRLALIVGILLLALVAIFWPCLVAPISVGLNPSVPVMSKINLRWGIDIRGGTSLLYEIKPPEGSQPDPDLAVEVVKALKRRVDPLGLMNLIWLPQGSTRIEIQMPLSDVTGKSQAIQDHLEAARKTIQATNVDVALVASAIEGKPSPAINLDDLKKQSPARNRIVTDMKDAYAALQQARQKADADVSISSATSAPGVAAATQPATQPAGPSLAQRNLLAQDIASVVAADQHYHDLQQELAATNFDPKKIDEIYNAKGNHDKTLDDLKKSFADFPARAAAVNEYITAKDSLDQLARSGGSLESASDLKHLLRGSGVLEFHILADKSDRDLGTDGYQGWVKRLQHDGPAVRPGDKFRWFEVQDPEQFKHEADTAPYNDRTWVLASIKPIDSLDHNSGPWELKNARSVRDQSGQLVVSFEFDSAGALKFGTLTQGHINKAMAIMLDGQTISAPNINSAITGGSGEISGGGDGGFSRKDADYLARMLSAGSLKAALTDEPISERTVGPQLGADNLKAGLLSCGLGLLVIAVFLIGYYYKAGVIAFGAIILNIILILGTMAAIPSATLTLPGIAAIVLTIGTSVDANVLVFERLREEQHRGLPLRMALRNAYDRALSAIVDSNVTTIITSLALIMFGTEDVKGFGITLLIGIVCSLFTALFVTRTVFTLLIEDFGLRELGSIPLSFPKWDKLLKPNVDWMGLAWIFYVFSAILISSGLLLLWHYGKAGEMMDIEFAGGTAVTFDLTKPQSQEVVRDWISKEPADQLPQPSLQRIGNEGTTWEVTTPNKNTPQVRSAILNALGENLKAQRPSKFAFAGASLEEALKPTSRAVVPITNDNLNKPAVWVGGYVPPEARQKYLNGVAVMLRGLEPKLSPNQIRDRIRHQMVTASASAEAKSDAINAEAAAAARDMSVVASTGPDVPTDSAVVLTSDPAYPYETSKPLQPGDAKPSDLWQTQLAKPIWDITNYAITREADLQQIKNFDASVATDTQNKAFLALLLSVLAIMVYIWIRFGNLKYGTATVVALLHDVLFTVAALGFAHLLSGNLFSERVLRLEPFRINMTVVAGILTIMSYSMIDTIVVFDRIRENRGKYGHVSRKIINDAVNQTLSRTLLTAGTTIIMVAIMYFLGGAGIHGFTFVLLIGILVGTYSSVAIAAPILLLGNEATEDAPGEVRRAGATGAIRTKPTPTA